MTIEHTALHQQQPVLATGEALNTAQAALILIHGRGSSAENILSLGEALAQPGFAFLAPQAAGSTWYPDRFLAPLANNEPYLSSALAAIADLVAHVDRAGVPTARTLILGFSQGACLALEFAARNARRYGGIVGLSGALVGPEGTPRHYAGSLDGTPVFLGCSDADFHVPAAYVRHTAEVLHKLGGQVTTRLYPNMGHTINQDEIDAIRGMMASLLG